MLPVCHRDFGDFHVSDLVSHSLHPNRYLGIGVTLSFLHLDIDMNRKAFSPIKFLGLWSTSEAAYFGEMQEGKGEKGHHPLSRCWCKYTRRW
jgi:hypothetical protein